MHYDLPEEVSVTERGPVRIVTLNRPDHLNAVNAGLHRGVASVWRQLAADPDARAVVLTGSGRAFCAGGEIDWFVELQSNPAKRAQLMLEAKEIMVEMARFPLPVIAAVNGPAMGLGCSLVVLSDVVYMADTAVLADTHVPFGLVAGDGGAATWPLMTGLINAKWYLFTGDPISADEALRLGLATRILPKADLLEAALAAADRLAALPPFALQSTKRALNMHLERALVGVMDYALAAESECFTLPEHHEKVAAFLAKSGKGREA
jgi:enoyl-CoA hydratase